MPLLQELVTKFTSDMTQMDKGFDEAGKSAEEYAQKHDEIMRQTEESARETGSKVEEALSSPYPKVMDVITKFATKHPVLTIFTLTTAAIIKERMEWNAYKEKVQETTDALWDQSKALGVAAVKAGEYGREMAKALAEQEGKSAEGHTAAYAKIISDEEATRRIAEARTEAAAARAAMQEAKLAPGAFRYKWSDKLNPFGAPWKDSFTAEEKRQKQIMDDANKRANFYRGIKAIHAQQADEAAAVAQEQAAANAKIASVELETRTKATVRAQERQAKEAVQSKREAERERQRIEAQAAQNKENAARQAAIDAESARDAQVQNAANQYFIAAELAADQYDKQRLEIKGRHLETLRQIERTGADETAVRLAILRSSNALKDVDAKQTKEAEDQRKRESDLAAKEAKAEADAVAKQRENDAREAEKAAKAAIEAKRRELEAQTKELEDARRDAYSKVGFTGIDEIGRNAVVSGMRAQFVSQQDLLRGSALTGMGAAARENDRLISSNQQQVALLEKLLRAFESAWRATPQGI